VKRASTSKSDRYIASLRFARTALTAAGEPVARQSGSESIASASMVALVVGSIETSSW
jgi:hypothetical protein